jgi:predicted HTH domain antitoxin
MKPFGSGRDDNVLFYTQEKCSYTLSPPRLAIITSMQVTFDIPDTLAAQLTAAGKDPARAALEALLVEAYRNRQIFEGEIKRILGYGTRMQVHALLKEHNVPNNYDVEEFEKDLETLHRLRERESPVTA